MQNTDISKVNKIYLTASGGPLLNKSLSKINKIKIKDVLKHPNWKMGKKITVDSSNLMNKVFEIIEARNIFGLDIKKLSILIHPKSYIHAIVKFNSGMIKVIAHDTTMEIPIFNSVYQNKKIYSKNIGISLKNLNNLNLRLVDQNKFKSIKILKMLPNKISLFETVIVSANDELVRSYLRKDIRYKDIVLKLYKIMRLKEFIKLKKITPKKITDIIKLDQYVRLKIKTKSV